MREGIRLFMDEDGHTAVPPNAAFVREIKHERIEYLIVWCEKNLVTYPSWHTFLNVFYDTLD